MSIAHCSWIFSICIAFHDNHKLPQCDIYTKVYRNLQKIVIKNRSQKLFNVDNVCPFMLVHCNNKVSLKNLRNSDDSPLKHCFDYFLYYFYSFVSFLDCSCKFLFFRTLMKRKKIDRQTLPVHFVILLLMHCFQIKLQFPMDVNYYILSRNLIKIYILCTKGNECYIGYISSSYSHFWAIFNLYINGWTLNSSSFIHCCVTDTLTLFANLYRFEWNSKGKKYNDCC